MRRTHTSTTLITRLTALSLGALFFATLLAPSAGAQVAALDSCSVDWVEIDDGTDSKEITIDIVGSADKYAAVLDTRFRSFIPVDYLGRFDVGETSFVKTNHDNDWDYLSVRPILDNGTKGDWIVCGNTSIFGPDLPAVTPKTSTCSVSGDSLSVQGNQAARIETRQADGSFAFLENRDFSTEAKKQFALAELGVESASDVRLFDLVYGFPNRVATDATLCSEVPVDAPVLPELECRKPTFYLGFGGRQIVGPKASAPASVDNRVDPRSIIFRASVLVE